MNLNGAMVYSDGETMKNMLRSFYDVIGMEQPTDSFFYLQQ